MAAKPAPLQGTLLEAAQQLAFRDHMVLARHTVPDEGMLHYSTGAALARARPDEYVIQRVGRTRVIRRIPGPLPDHGPDPADKAWAKAWDAARKHDEAAAADRLSVLADRITELQDELAALTPDRDALIRRLSDAGLSLDDIAVIARLSHITVRRIKDAKDAGL